jgi:hypothetical protein
MLASLLYRRIGEGQILFVLECANFCPRVLIVPASEFCAARLNDLKLLRDYAENSGAQSTPHHVLIQNYIFNQNVGTPEIHPWSQFIFNLMSLVDLRVSFFDHNDDCVPMEFANDADRQWVSKSSFSISEEFDPIVVFNQLTKKTFFFDSFLVLEKRKGRAAPL